MSAVVVDFQMPGLKELVGGLAELAVESLAANTALFGTAEAVTTADKDIETLTGDLKGLSATFGDSGAIDQWARKVENSTDPVNRARNAVDGLSDRLKILGKVGMDLANEIEDITDPTLRAAEANRTWSKRQQILNKTSTKLNDRLKILKIRAAVAVGGLDNLKRITGFLGVNLDSVGGLVGSLAGKLGGALKAGLAVAAAGVLAMVAAVGGMALAVGNYVGGAMSDFIKGNEEATRASDALTASSEGLEYTVGSLAYEILGGEEALYGMAGAMEALRLELETNRGGLTSFSVEIIKNAFLLHLASAALKGFAGDSKNAMSEVEEANKKMAALIKEGMASVEEQAKQLKFADDLLARQTQAANDAAFNATQKKKGKKQKDPYTFDENEIFAETDALIKQAEAIHAWDTELRKLAGGGLEAIEGKMDSMRDKSKLLRTQISLVPEDLSSASSYQALRDELAATEAQMSSLGQAADVVRAKESAARRKKQNKPIDDLRTSHMASDMRLAANDAMAGGLAGDESFQREMEQIQTAGAWIEGLNVTADAGQKAFRGLAEGVGSVVSAMAHGGEAADHMGDQIQRAFGGLASNLGQFFVLQGTGLLFTPGGQGAGLGMIAAGLGLQALGGLMEGGVTRRENRRGGAASVARDVSRFSGSTERRQVGTETTQPVTLMVGDRTMNAWLRHQQRENVRRGRTDGRVTGRAA